MTCYHPEKVKHATLEEAREHIRRLYRAGRGNPDYQAYPCDGGAHWHIGHSMRHFHERIRKVVRHGSSVSVRGRRMRHRR